MGLVQKTSKEGVNRSRITEKAQQRYFGFAENQQPSSDIDERQCNIYTIQFACAVGTIVSRKFTGSNFGCTLRFEFFTHSFPQSSSDGTVTSAFAKQSATAAGEAAAV